MSTQTGLPKVNGEVLSAINDMIGRIILINTTDKKRYSGVLSAVSPDFAFGLQCVVEITKKNENNLLRTEAETIDKMLFNFNDIVDFAHVTEDDKKQHFASKFATDRQYHGDAAGINEELQEWNGGEEDDCLGGSIEDDVVTTTSQSARRNNQSNGTGWSVNEMFAVNEKMNVVSTFKEDLTQYTTVDVVGTDEDRARAERLAREIESNSSSKFMANLENDDDERDLDKVTRQEDFDNGNNQRGGKRNSTNYNQQSQQRRNQNITPNGQPVNRRAEGLRGDRRNSGSSSANNSRYNQSAPTQSYQQSQQSQKSGNYSNRRPTEEYRENDWQMAKGKGQNQGHDHSFRQQQKQMLDPRPNAKQSEVEKGQGSGSRVTELKNWGNEFSIATSPKEQSPAPGSTPPVSQGNSGSAWNRGPPSSLVAKGSTQESVSPAATNNSSATDVPKAANEKIEVFPSTSGEGQSEVDGQQEDADDVSLTDRSETSSVITSKSSSFKFNINAPEFKPRVAPSTPTPTTPTGPAPQNINNHIATQQYVPPNIIPAGAPQGPPMGMPGMVPNMGLPGGIPQNQNQPVVMWQQGQQGYTQNQQFPIQQVPMPGVPGQMYGAAATAPTTVNQSASTNQQVPTNTSGGPPVDGRQLNSQSRRDGEYREAQPLFYPYGQSGQMMQVPQQFYPAQYQGAMQQQYQMKMLPQQQGHQSSYPQRFQQQQPLYMIPQGQNSQQRYQGPPQQSHQFAGEQGGPQSHPNSQPTTPGPRGDINGQKSQQAPPPQTQNNSSHGVNREPEAGSNASLSGSGSSQSGQRSGSPQNNVVQSTTQHQHVPPHQAPPHLGPPHGGPPMVPVTQQQHMSTYVVVPPQMHPQMPNYYSQQQIYYQPMMVPPQMQMQQNQHGQQSLMGERADTGYAQNNYFDYRTMPNYQQNQQHQHQHQQMHGGHIPRQNSIPQQQFGNNQGVNSSSQQAQPSTPQQHSQQQQQLGATPREQQPQQKALNPQ